MSKPKNQSDGTLIYNLKKALQNGQTTQSKHVQNIVNILNQRQVKIPNKLQEQLG